MDRRGIYKTEFWGAVMWIALIVLVIAEAVWVRAWTWAWAIGLVVSACVGWLCVVQYGAAKKRSRERQKEAERAKILALDPQQSHLKELGSRVKYALAATTPTTRSMRRRAISSTMKSQILASVAAQRLSLISRPIG